MARRPGPVRLAVLDTARRLLPVQHSSAQAHRRGVTYLDLEARLVPLGVARHMVRRTLEQLVRDGLMVRVDNVPMPHSRRPLGAYAPAANDDPQHALPMGLDLQDLLRDSWRCVAAA
jgi:hypothetical protein